MLIKREVISDKPFYERDASILRIDPNLQQYKSLLYIGSKMGDNPKSDGYMGGRHLDLFKGFDITLMDAWLPNVEGLKKHFPKVIHSDIRDYLDSGAQYDVVMWWHGPEHIPEEELPPILEGIKKLAKHLVILGCPYGKYPQADSGGNPFEVHESHLIPEFFHQFEYHTEALFFPEQKTGRQTNVTAWFSHNKQG